MEEDLKDRHREMSSQLFPQENKKEKDSKNWRWGLNNEVYSLQGKKKVLHSVF